MEPLICPRCRTRIPPADTIVRCPTCGVRSRAAVTAKTPSRRASTAIAEGMPDVPAPLHDGPQSVLDRLTAQSRQPQVSGEDPSDEAECRRIGWWLLALRLLPFIVGGFLVLLVPAGVFATLTRFDPETVALPDLLILTALIVGPLSLGAGLVWLVVRRSNTDDEDASR